jgi:hypothetical protein
LKVILIQHPWRFLLDYQHRILRRYNLLSELSENSNSESGIY